MPRTLFTMIVALAAFVLGWWANQRFSSSPSERVQEVTTPIAAENRTAWLQSPPALQEQSRAQPPRIEDSLTRGDVDTAMGAFDSLVSVDPDQFSRWRAVVLEALRIAVQGGDTALVQRLSDAWLDRYYDDIDVLLLLAEHQRLQGYPDEAVRAVHYANTYAYEARDREKVADYTRSLVSETDALLGNDGQWVELLGFYRVLESLGLATAGDQLAQAVVCLELGDLLTARGLLEPLLAHVQLGEQVAALLSGMATPQDVSQPVHREGIALARQGGHYLLPVLLNGEASVTLMIDTGATITSVAQDRFNELNDDTYFQYLGWRIFNTAGGRVRGNIYRASTLELGNYVMSDVDIAVLNYHQRDGVDGLLGMNVLRQFRFEIDQDRSQLILERRE